MSMEAKKALATLKYLPLPQELVGPTLDTLRKVGHSTAEHSAAGHGTAEHSTARCSTYLYFWHCLRGATLHLIGVHAR